MEQDESLYSLFVSCIEANNKKDVSRDVIFEEIIKRFEPLLIKYALKLNNVGEKYSLSIAIYTALLKMPMSVERFKEDKYILSYVKESVYHEFLRLRYESGSRESLSLDDEYFQNTMIGNSDDFSQFWCDNQLQEIERILKPQEFDIFWLTYIGLSETEIAKTYSITRQAICKRLKKIRNKIIANLQLVNT